MKAETAGTAVAVCYKLVRDCAVWFLVCSALDVPQWLYGALGVVALLLVLSVLYGVSHDAAKRRKAG